MDKISVDSVAEQAQKQPDTTKETGWENEEWHELAEGDPTIILRDIPKEQAKQEVRTLLASSSKPLDHGEIADELCLVQRGGNHSLVNASSSDPSRPPSDGSEQSLPRSIGALQGEEIKSSPS
jgi:hypothetical protein